MLWVVDLFLRATVQENTLPCETLPDGVIVKAGSGCRSIILAVSRIVF